MKTMVAKLSTSPNEIQEENVHPAARLGTPLWKALFEGIHSCQHCVSVGRVNTPSLGVDLQLVVVKASFLVGDKLVNKGAYFLDVYSEWAVKLPRRVVNETNW